MDENIAWSNTVLPVDATVENAINCLNQTGLKIVLVVYPNGRFAGTVTDGDIRRAMLDGVLISAKIEAVMNKKPVVASPLMSPEVMKQMMEVNKLQQLPILDREHKLVGLSLWDRVSLESIRHNTMVIMAGGLGTRLRPYTENCPKPMLPVAGKPMLEHIILRAKKDGFRNFVITTRYLGHMIEEYFGSGELLDVNIEYIREDEPLGTAGSLSLLGPEIVGPIVVSNSDVLTDISYGDLLDFHKHKSVTATMAIRVYELQHPFGVVGVNGFDIVSFQEKPVYRTKVNAGIYVVNKEVLSLIERKEACDMPIFLQRLMQLQHRVVVYPMHELWTDIGRESDYYEANKAMSLDKELAL